MIRNEYAILPVELSIGSAVEPFRESCVNLSEQGLLNDDAGFFDVRFFRTSLQFNLDCGYLNQGQGGMCIRLRRGIGLGIWQECFGP